MKRQPVYVSVCDGVYPVSEDTLLMLSCVEVEPGERALEMGCGAGLVGIHMALCGAEVVMADVDPVAAECARKNAADAGVDAVVVESDLFENIDGVFDVIVFNPPYLPGAGGDQRLDGGEGGIEVADRFLMDAPRHLKDCGRVYLLLSSLSDIAALRERHHGWVWELVGEKRLFFETLYVYRLRLSVDGEGEKTNTRSVLPG